MNDKELEKQFQQDGYVIIPFLNDSEVADLKKAFLNYCPRAEVTLRQVTPAWTH